MINLLETGKNICNAWFDLVDKHPKAVGHAASVLAGISGGILWAAGASFGKKSLEPELDLCDKFTESYFSSENPDDFAKASTDHLKGYYKSIGLESDEIVKKAIDNAAKKLIKEN